MLAQVISMTPAQLDALPPTERATFIQLVHEFAIHHPCFLLTTIGQRRAVGMPM
jgi:hypothetical protein